MNYQQSYSGQKLRISASQWNAVRRSSGIADGMARSGNGSSHLGVLGPGEFFGYVDSDTGFYAGTVGYIDAFNQPPADLVTNRAQFSFFIHHAEYNEKYPMAVAMEDVPGHSIGRFKCSGYCLAKWTGTDVTSSYAIPDGNDGLASSDAGGLVVLAADSNLHIAAVLLPAIGGSGNTTGQFDTAIIAEVSGSVTNYFLECWNSNGADGEENAGVMSVNGQNFNVPTGRQQIVAGQKVYLYAKFTAAHDADDSSDLDGTSNQTSVPASAVLWLSTELLSSSPTEIYELIAVVNEDLTLDKCRPRGMITAVWFGPASDLWKDTFAEEEAQQ